jgi:hypothetical protein
VGAGYSVTSCDLRILMDQSTESISSHDSPSRHEGRWFAGPERWRLRQGAVRTVAVVMIGILGQHRPQLPTPEDRHCCIERSPRCDCLHFAAKRRQIIGTVEWFDLFLAPCHVGEPPLRWASPAYSGSMQQCPVGSARRNGQILWIAGPPDHAAPSVWLVGLITSLLGCVSAETAGAGATRAAV